MNRKFKHKKTGTIIEKGKCFGEYYSGTNTKKEKIYLPTDLVEDSSDWEEIIEKEYEILSYQIESIIQKATCFKNSQFGGNSEWKIYSVKRLSDGEIFTLKDTINGNQTIISIEIIDGKIRIYPRNSFYKLEDVKKEKKREVLFRTEDGVDIFKGNKFWCAHNGEYGTRAFQWTVSNTPYVATDDLSYTYKTDKELINRNGNFYFSTKEKAEEFIILNKPCLSINDLLSMEEARGISLITKSDDIFLIAKTIVEQKLKDKV